MKKAMLILFIVVMAVPSITEGKEKPLAFMVTYKVVKTKTVNVSPLCLAVVQGDFGTVKRLIELGEDVNKVSKNSMTPLMYAARHNRIEVMKLLLANGAKVRVKCSKGYTAMKYAELSNAADAKELLKMVSARK